MLSFDRGESPQPGRCLNANTAQWAPSPPCQGNPQSRHWIGWVSQPPSHNPAQICSAPRGAEHDGGQWWHLQTWVGLYPIECGNVFSLDSSLESSHRAHQERNSISNKTVVHSQCPLINDLFTILATSFLWL